MPRPAGSRRTRAVPAGSPRGKVSRRGAATMPDPISAATPPPAAPPPISAATSSPPGRRPRSTAATSRSRRPRPTRASAAISARRSTRRRRARAAGATLIVDGRAAGRRRTARRSCTSRSCCATPACTRRRCSPPTSIAASCCSRISATARISPRSTPRRRPRLYSDAIDALIRWQCASREHELPPYDEALLRARARSLPRLVRRAAPRRDPHGGAGGYARARRSGCVLDNNLAQPRVFVHRDYHSRNLMVCDAQSRRPRFPGRGVRPDHLRPRARCCATRTSRGTRSGRSTGRCATGSARAGPAFRSAPISATSGAISNGWACSASSRCWASSRACTTATARPATSPTCRA